MIGMDKKEKLRKRKAARSKKLSARAMQAYIDMLNTIYAEEERERRKKRSGKARDQTIQIQAQKSK